jgi:hypothetical protein
MEKEEKENNPLFTIPVTLEEFEHELEKFWEEEELTSETGKTLACRWVDLTCESEGADSAVRNTIMEIAQGDHNLHDSLYRVLNFGLEIGYRLGIK